MKAKRKWEKYTAKIRAERDEMFALLKRQPPRLYVDRIAFEAEIDGYKKEIAELREWIGPEGIEKLTAAKNAVIDELIGAESEDERNAVVENYMKKFPTLFRARIR